MKSILVSAVMFAMSSGSALAASFADFGDMGIFSFTGAATASPDPVVVGSSSITLSNPNAVGAGTEELEALVGFVPALVNPFVFPTTVGDIIDQLFSVSFNRSGISDPADMPPGSETGQLTFTLSELTAVSSSTGPLGTNVTLDGILSVAQTSGTQFYDPETGVFRINAEFPAVGSDSFTLTIGLPASVEVPLPAPALLLLSGLAAFGLFRRFRSAA